jgi:hypothetical protein
MARDACLVLEALSGNEAREITRLLAERGYDVEREGTIVWYFVVGTNPRRAKEPQERTPAGRRSARGSALDEA